MWKPLVLIFLLSTLTAADTYKPHLELSIGDFLGACNETQVNQGSLYAVGECVGNALDPAIPNPLKIFDPITGENYQEKKQYLDFFPLNDKGEFDITLLFTSINKILNAVWNFPIIVFSTLIEIAFNAVKFVLVFAIRFIFTYLFWVSIAFQTLLSYFSEYKLENRDRVVTTVFIMIVASIAVLGYGSGGIIWS